MKTLNPSNLDFCRTVILGINKTEVIHEDDKEGESEDSSDDDEDVDAVFGHKQANRNKLLAKETKGHEKKPSMGDLKVNVDGPIKTNPNQFHQRVPFSATHPSKWFFVESVNCNPISPQPKFWFE